MKTPIFGTLAAAGASMYILMAAPAHAACGPKYEFKSGDTLYSVSQKCRVSLSTIMALNPGIKPRDIAIGTVIQLRAGQTAGNDDRDDRQRAGGDHYRVEPGDTFYSIAQALGVSVIELMNANGEVNPFSLVVGNLLDIPGEQPTATVRVNPNRGQAGDQVRIRARNLRPNDWVTIGVGPRASEWRAIDHARVAADGELRTSVRVPRWADAGDDLVFVVDTDRGLTFKSDLFHVVAGDGDDDRDDDRGGGNVAMEGFIRHGTECYLIRTPDGGTWSVVSDNVEFTAGEYVEIRGDRVQVSKCMQGQGTIDVERIREVRAPENRENRG